MRQAINKVDFAKMIAAGTIEQMLIDYPQPVPWPCFHLAQCAIYLSRDGEARELLRDAVKYAGEDGRANYERVIAQAETYLAKLDADPDALRGELTSMINYNWSHLKVVA